MGDTHMDPVNAGARFILELMALYGIGRATWELSENGVAVAGAVVLAAFIWGRYRVPDDPGPAPVPVRGVTRLAIEAAVLIGGGVGLAAAHLGPGVVFFLALIVHYATTGRRLRHMLSFR